MVPNSNIKPEYTYNFDVTVQQKIAGKITVEATGFYTLFKNAIVTRPFSFNGQDSIIYNGIKAQVLASQNAGSAKLYGFSAGFTATLHKKFTASAVVSYTCGRFKTDPSKPTSIYEKQLSGSYSLVSRNVTSVPLDHIPPLFAKATLDLIVKNLKQNYPCYTMDGNNLIK